MARGVYARKGNEWSTDQLRKLAALKQQGAMGAVIAEELGKTTTQVHNKWLYIKRVGISRALEMAVDPPASRNGHSIPYAPASAPGDHSESLPLGEIKATIEFVKAMGGSERATYLVGTLSSLGAV